MTDERSTPALPATTEDNKVPYYIQPQDELEEELLTQMRETAQATGHCFQLGMKEGMSFAGKVGYLSLASKLSRSYAALVQALNHSRGKNTTEQRIIVQYVNVADGGQAIVGGSMTPAKGGGHPKNEEPPHAK